MQPRYRHTHGGSNRVDSNFESVPAKSLGSRTSLCVRQKIVTSCQEWSQAKLRFSGSIKANFGHLEGASGLAGVIKAILVLEKGIIPPNASLETMISTSEQDFSNIEVGTLIFCSVIPAMVTCRSFSNLNTSDSHTVHHLADVWS